ncbi:hypothetical protein CHLNCDRAFT_32765 [Chlorella variabilis]|uniref:Amino acid transporter transmembrane domain-containing protein n=1 Tax=Chlorella variabilis TaxID=554065 RepID=E1ZQA6_CHLVA|nr:hypothetical protein CHLNCDRAFT_32765 [Chlorella variabilis]EFN51990.1 hypothetical protein CHLNCDRAFT_32765 [Chlorella variabilis]|eukprot:XP_005844092.1 hypothetical protein CHLNCDRAFT_32765 [Chlorella variabilis]
MVSLHLRATTMAGDAGEQDIVPNGKTGTKWTAVGHIFCAIVGAGVLGLPNSMAWLGWVAGPICLIVFFAVSMWSSHLLARLYCVDGIEFARYHHAVQHILGRPGAIAISIFQLLNLVLSDIAYSITGAIAMQTVADLIGSPFRSEWKLVLIMGAFELVFSQIPSLEKIWWVSALGTASSLGYVTISLILGLVYSGNRGGTVGGRPGTSPANKAFGMLNALGNIAFAFGFAQVLMEIQDTLRQPPRAVHTMTSAVRVAVTAAFGFYISSAIACYSALGNGVPGMVLQGFEDAPEWILVVANICIVIHMVTAWQVWAQPVYETIESIVKAYMIKRQMRSAGLAPEKEESKLDAKVAEPHKPSPFDVGHRPGSVTHQHQAEEVHHLPPVTETVDMERGLSGASSGRSDRLSRRSTARTSGSMAILNSAPIPDLLPAGGWKRRTRGAGSNASLASMDKPKDSATGAHPNLNRSSIGNHLARLSVELGSEAMYHIDTGAANEHVPMNDEGYYLPFWQRLVIRSTYVLLCTIIAMSLPFFNAIVGLIGAITFWPLTVGFPFAMYAKVYKPAGPMLLLMKVTALVMLLVAVAAAIASCQNIIDSWSTFTFFS